MTSNQHMRLRELFSAATHEPVAQVPDVAEAIEEEANAIIDSLVEQYEGIQAEWDDYRSTTQDILDVQEADYARLKEQLETLDSALRDILDITEGWTPKMDLEVRLKRIDAYAKEALKANSNPAKRPT